MPSQSIKAYVMGEGLQKVLAISALVILYLFFSRFGTHFATMDTFVSILDSSYYLGFLALETRPTIIITIVIAILIAKGEGCKGFLKKFF